MFYSSSHASPLATLTLASDGEKLVGLWLAGQRYFAATVKGPLEEKPELPVFVAAKKWLDAYFAGKKPGINALPLAPAGSGFRKSVWNILCEIPYGQCVTYGEIAKKIARLPEQKKPCARAVGGAVGHNPISIIIPCHRVMGAGGRLTGYAGGLDKKLKLLEHEGVDMAGLL